MGIISRAFRNVTRRKTRALLVIIALAFSVSIVVSIMQGTVANQAAAESVTSNLSDTMSNMQNQLNQSATLIECSTSSGRFQSIGGFSAGQRVDIGGQGGIGGPPSFQTMGGTSFVNETVVEEISTIEGVKDIVVYLECPSNETVEETIMPFTIGTGPSGTAPGGAPRNFTLSRSVYTVRGVSLNSPFIDQYDVLPANITAGRNLREGDSRVCLLTTNLTAYFGVNVGESVSINETSLTVVGVYEPPSSSQTGYASNILYMSLEDARAVTSLAGKASKLDVYVKDASYVTFVGEAIELAYNDELYVSTNEDRLQSLQTMQDNYQTTLENAQVSLAQSQVTATQEIVIAIAATSLIVLFVMLYTVRERTKEIGTLKAIGFSSGNIMSQFVAEGAILSLVAGAVGIAIGSVLAPALSSLLVPSINMFGSSRFTSSGGTFTAGPVNQVSFGAPSTTASVAIDPMLLLIAFGAAVLLGVVGSLYPAWRASRTKPAEAMRYE